MEEKLVVVVVVVVGWEWPWEVRKCVISEDRLLLGLGWIVRRFIRDR
jgi:hypothetical protein